MLDAEEWFTFSLLDRIESFLQTSVWRSDKIALSWDKVGSRILFWLILSMYFFHDIPKRLPNLESKKVLAINP